MSCLNLNFFLEWSSDFIYFNRWTSTSPGKTVFLEKDNSLSLTRDWYASTSSIPSQQILYCILFIVFYYFAFC